MKLGLVREGFLPNLGRCPAAANQVPELLLKRFHGLALKGL